MRSRQSSVVLSRNDSLISNSRLGEDLVIERSKGCRYEGDILVIPSTFIQRSSNTIWHPHELDIQYQVEIEPVLYVGMPIILQLSGRSCREDEGGLADDRRIVGDIVGVYMISQYRITFIVVGWFANQLQVIFLSTLRDRVNWEKLPAPFLVHDGRLKWVFVSPRSLRNIGFLLTTYSEDPNRATATFVRRIHPSLQVLRERDVGVSQEIISSFYEFEMDRVSQGI